jgi:hypothetical protein
MIDNGSPLWLYLPGEIVSKIMAGSAETKGGKFKGIPKSFIRDSRIWS